MARTIHISITEYAYRRLFDGFKGNRSKRAEALMLIGQDAEIDGMDKIKLRLQEAEKQIRQFNEEIGKLKSENGLLKEKLGKKKERSQDQLLYDAIVTQGLLK